MNLQQLPSLDRLKKAFQRLPGVGPKSALRMALHVLQSPQQDAIDLLESIQTARDQLRFCLKCHSFSEGTDICKVCSDPTRNDRMVCMVEDPFVVLTLEQRTKADWTYYVTHGLIAPLDNLYPEDLKLDKLFERLADIEELIVAFSSSVEGEATAAYIKGEIQKRAPQIRLTRIAHGIPFGTRLETVDQMTLEQALRYRQPMA